MKTKTTFIKKPLVLAVGAALAGTSPMAVSQSADSETGLFEEIIVTATARESSVQDIPYNISAMSGEAMKMQNIVNQYDLMRSMHGISVIDRGYRNAGMVNSIVIRGLNVDNGSNGDIQLNAVPTVATYYDNVPMYANFLLKDLQRVEVLRGPQGTLYGSGSLGGTVRYIANRPNPKDFEAAIDLDYGQTSGSDGNNVAADVMFNLPLGEMAAVRVNYSKIDNDGMIDYINAYQLSDIGEPLVNVGGTCVDPQSATDNEVLYNVGCFHEVEDADTVDIEYARVSIRVEPSDRFSFQLSYQNQEDNIGARRATTSGDNNQPSGDPLYFEYGDDDSGMVLLEPSSREADLVSMDLEFDFGFATFTSSTSALEHVGRGDSDNGGLWASGGLDGNGDEDGTSRDWNWGLYGGVWPRPAQRAERGYDDEVFIQEFRLVSNEGDGNIDWLVGAFYLDQETDVWQMSHNPGMDRFSTACINTGDPVCTTGGWYGGFWPRWYPQGLTEIDFEYNRNTQYEEKALYGELTYHISDTARVTAGFRWFDNDTVNNTRMGFPLINGSGWWDATDFAPSTAGDSDTLFKLNGSWDLAGDKMLYATYSEGYRHGGAQAVPSPGDPFGEANAEAIREFESDTVTNYEFGLKGRTERLSYTAAAFYVDWDNPQLNTVSNGWGFFLADNGDKATTQGVELEVEGYIGESTHYRVGYTYVNAELGKDFNNTQSGSLVAPKGSDLPAAPNSVVSFNFDKSWHLGGDRDLIVGLNGYYQSGSQNFLTKDHELSQSWDAFSLIGLTATLVDESWNATLYIRNVGDEAGLTGGFPTSYFSYDTGTFESWYGNGNRQFIVQPRTIGLKFGYRF